MKKIVIFLCMAVMLIIFGCNRQVVNPDEKMPSKKDIVLQYGTPYEEITTQGIEVLTYETWCGWGGFLGTKYYCLYQEFFFESNKLIKEITKEESRPRRKASNIKLDVDMRDGRTSPVK
jgi:hypothetical protein